MIIQGKQKVEWDEKELRRLLIDQRVLIEQKDIKPYRITMTVSSVQKARSQCAQKENPLFILMAADSRAVTVYGDTVIAIL